MEIAKSCSTDILIVDDDPINAKILSYWCTKWGYSSEVAFTGQEALSKAIGEKYKLLILDIILPDLSGIEVANGIRNLGLPSEIIFQSGLSESEYLCKVDEPSLFLQKPYAPKVMAEIISLIMEKHALKVSA